MSAIHIGTLIVGILIGWLIVPLILGMFRGGLGKSA